MNKMTAIYTTPTKSHTLTLTAQAGKSGFNVKASVKAAKDSEGKSPKAITGGRGNYQSEGEAAEAFNALKEQAESSGYVRVQRASKNAFTTIPTVGELSKIVQMPAPASAVMTAAAEAVPMTVTSVVGSSETPVKASRRQKSA